MQPVTTLIKAANLQPEMAGVSAVGVGSVASYWYWFSHGVPLADA